MARHLPRPALVALLAASSALAAGCGHGGSKPVRSCQADTECGGVGQCVAGLCQASAPPVADFGLPSVLTTQREITLTSTAHDPDPGDAIAAWSWTVTRAGAACDAEVSGRDGPSLQVVFWCPGTYRIGLTVTDSTAEESASLERTVDVAQTTSAPALTIAGAAKVDHRCSGAPLRCGLAAPLDLAAHAQAADGGALSYRWSIVPPDADRAGVVTTFAPSAGAASLALQLDLGGADITGAWAVQVRARDSAGNLAVGTHAFEVGNRPPVIRAADGSGDGEIALDHTVGDCPTGGGRCYLASGAEAFVAVDPDGDPLGPVTLTADAAGAGAGSLAEAGVGGRAAAFRFSTPLGDPGAFRASDGASGFHVKGTVTDAHGASASLSLTARIGNRAPVATRAPSSVSIPHTWSAAANAYLAGTSLADFTDPDGDPLEDAGSSGDAVCGRFTASGGTVSVACLLPYAPLANQLPPLATLVAPHSVTARVSDGWASASSRSVISIQNRPPVVPDYAGPAEGCLCTCIKWLHVVEPGSPPDCLEGAVSSGGPATSYSVATTDPDGDPLMLTINYSSRSAAVVASDGVNSTSNTWTATAVVCPSAGASCTP